MRRAIPKVLVRFLFEFICQTSKESNYSYLRRFRKMHRFWKMHKVVRRENDNEIPGFFIQFPRDSDVGNVSKKTKSVLIFIYIYTR